MSPNPGLLVLPSSLTVVPYPSHPPLFTVPLLDALPSNGTAWRPQKIRALSLVFPHACACLQMHRLVYLSMPVSMPTSHLDQLACITVVQSHQVPLNYQPHGHLCCNNFSTVAKPQYFLVEKGVLSILHILRQCGGILDGLVAAIKHILELPLATCDYD